MGREVGCCCEPPLRIRVRRCGPSSCGCLGGVDHRPPEHRCSYCERELSDRRRKYCDNRGRCKQAAYRRRKRLQCRSMASTARHTM